jgi:mannose-6-phosphate isomerase-like protein (cupin superfamily)
MSAQKNGLKVVHRRSGDPHRSEKFGVYRIESLLSEVEEGVGTVYRIRIEPHQRTAISFHKVAEEYYFVISGWGYAILNGEERPLEAGDFIRLPPGTTHGFITCDQPLEMLDIHTPGCRPQRDTYFVEGT